MACCLDTDKKDHFAQTNYRVLVFWFKEN